MKTISVLESADALAVVEAAATEATRNGWKVSIAVVDAGGHLLCMQRLEGAAPATARISGAKAHTAALVRRDSKHYEDMINGGRQAFLSAPGIEGVLEGGIPLLKDGQCIGAVGVSGVAPAQDVQIARAGATAIGL